MVSHRRLLLGAALLTLAAARPLHAQRVQDWQYRWYWGIKAGMISYTLPTSGLAISPALGAEWMITQRRVALYLGYAQSFTAEADTFLVNGLSGSQFVEFDGYRQIQIDIVAFVGDKQLQPYVGGGFVLATLTNARQPSASTTVATAITDASSGAFVQILLGAQYRFAKKGAVFGQFQYTPQGQDFLLAGSASVISGGVRWAFLSSRDTDQTMGR
jgi:hypothetical protein